MSVKKYRISKNSGNFTTIPNKVLQNLKNYEALGLYCYIASLPHGWEFHKSQLSEHANIGRDRLSKALKILSVHQLIKIEQKRDSKGQFTQFTLHVDDGTNFKINNLEEYCAPLTEKPLTDNQLPENDNYKENKYKSNKKHKENISCASDDAPSLFDEFWESYPVKKNKKRALDVWKSRKCEAKANLIIADVRNRTLKDPSWENAAFICHPERYLRNERWKDEIAKNEKKSAAATCTIKDYRPMTEDLKPTDLALARQQMSKLRGMLSNKMVQ